MSEATSTSGSVTFMFDKTCHFKVAKGELDPEELELEMIDHGVEEVFVEDETIVLYGPFESFGSMQKALEDQQIEIISSGFERIPNVPTKQLNPEQTEEVEKLLERIEEDDDVQQVYHTMG